MSIPYDMEERTEDAFVSRLNARIDTANGLKFYPAFTEQKITYPSASVLASDETPISETAEWHTPRMIAVSISVATEFAPEMDGTGQVLRTARQMNQDARTLVMNALTRFNAGDIVDDNIVPTVKRRSLLGQILDRGIAGVAFSMAQVRDVRRDVDTEKRKMVSMITADVIAEPVELSP
jgi:hypothetical protein